MGTTVEFYAADPQALKALFASQDDEQHFFDTLQTYPVADFSLHLVLPHDLDRLCFSLREHHLPAPLVFREFLAEQVWYDGVSESLTVLTEHFTAIFSTLSDMKIKAVAKEWSVVFNYTEVLENTPAYQALLQLRVVAQYASAYKKPIVLHLLS